MFKVASTKMVPDLQFGNARESAPPPGICPPRGLAALVTTVIQETLDVSDKQLFSKLPDLSAFRTVHTVLQEHAEHNPDLLMRARACSMLSDLIERYSPPGINPDPGLSEQWRDRMFGLLKQRTEEDFVKRERSRGLCMAHRPTRLQPLIVRSCAPVRVEFSSKAGSDAAPVALERGGAALCLSVNLNGAPPMEVLVRPITAPLIRLISDSPALQATEDILSRDQLISGKEDKLRLLKAAVILSGLVSPDEQRPLRTILKEMGGGLEIRTKARLPAMVGMGGSSVMGAALLDALYIASGQSRLRQDLVRDVLLLEQMIGRGGGWQDPFGGVFGGLNSLNSLPGQDPLREELDLPPRFLEELSRRLIVVDSGMPKQVTASLKTRAHLYFTRDEIGWGAMKRAGIIHARMRECILNGDISGLGAALTPFWRSVQRTVSVDQRVFEPFDAMFHRLDSFVDGWKCGTGGGGGFAVLIAKSDKVRAAREKLEDVLAATGGRIYAVEVNRHGLETTFSNMA